MVACDAVIEEETEHNTKLLAASILQSEQSANRGRGNLSKETGGNQHSEDRSVLAHGHWACSMGRDSALGASSYLRNGD